MKPRLVDAADRNRRTWPRPVMKHSERSMELHRSVADARLALYEAKVAYRQAQRNLHDFEMSTTPAGLIGKRPSAVVIVTVATMAAAAVIFAALKL